jgi:hypothetical protein
MPTTFPNTGSQIERTGEGTQGHTTTGLSTQIIIKVNGVAIGALQNLTVRQNRALERVREIGVDGVIEIVPRSATEYELNATRVVFDCLRMPEAFSRGFRFIAAQRVPFDIEVFDMSNMSPNVEVNDNSQGVVVMTYKNCWFTTYETPYQADNYIISETANMWAETAFITFPSNQYPEHLRDFDPQTDATSGVEKQVNFGFRRGAMDASGIVKSIFEEG